MDELAKINDKVKGKVKCPICYAINDFTDGENGTATVLTIDEQDQKNKVYRMTLEIDCVCDKCKYRSRRSGYLLAMDIKF